MGDSTEGALSRPLKAAFAAVVLTGLLAVVALAARGGHPGGHGRVHQREVPAWVGNDLLTIVVIAYVAALAILVAVAFSFRGAWGTPRNSRWLRQLVTVLALMGTVALLGTHLAGTDLGAKLRQRAAEAQKREPRAPKGRTLPKRPAAPRPAHLDWVLVAVLGGLVLAAVIVQTCRREPLEPLDAAQETVEEELSSVVADTIDDLRREADARRAVIAAYARMERVLAQHGHPRAPSEAPFEYLGRILLALQVRAGAVADLTELFERAKFSKHPIDQAMKERAIAALVSVRDELRPAAA